MSPRRCSAWAETPSWDGKDLIAWSPRPRAFSFFLSFIHCRCLMMAVRHLLHERARGTGHILTMQGWPAGSSALDRQDCTGAGRRAPHRRRVGARRRDDESALRVEEALAGVGQSPQERRWGPELVARCLLELHHAVANLSQPEGIGPEHRAPAVDGPAVAVDPDDVDVAGAAGDLLVEDLGALVHHRVEETLEDLVIRDRAPREPHGGRHVHDDLFHVGVGDGRTVALVVAVPAGARFLAEPAELADAIGHGRLHTAALA